MKKILLILSMFQFVANAQIVNKFRDSTWFKSGVQFDGNVVFKSGAASGKVWTSNSNGTGSWQTISSSGVSQGALNDSITAVRNIRKVDTIYKNTGGDSIVYTINGLRRAIIDRQNTGTVTSIATGVGLSGGTITGSGTLLVDTSTIVSKSFLTARSYTSNTGTVTSIATDNTLTGGPIISSGTLKVDTTIISTKNYALNIGNNKATFSALNDSITAVRSIRKVDTLYKNTGGDSIVFTINGLRASILDRGAVLFPNGFEDVTESRDFLHSDIGKALRLANENVFLTMPEGQFWTEEEKGQVIVIIADAQNVGFDKTYGKPVLMQGRDEANDMVGEYCLLVAGETDGQSDFGTISSAVIKDGDDWKTAIKYLYDNLGGGGVPLSSITAATATNSINNLNYKQRWFANTIGADTAFVLGTSSTAAASNLQTVLSVNQSGANATSTQSTYGIKISNKKTGTASTNIGIDLDVSGGGTNNAINVTSGSVLLNGNSLVFGPASNMLQFGGALNINANSVQVSPNAGTGQIHAMTCGGYTQFAWGMNASYNAPYFSMGGTVWNNGTTYYSYGTNSILFRDLAGDLAISQDASLSYGGTFTPTERIRFKANGTVGIGTSSPSANTKLEITTTTTMPIKLTPMTATQASALTAEDGGLIYVSDTNGTFTSVGFWGRENGVWVKL